MKQRLMEMVQVTALFHTHEFIFVWSFKNGNGRQNPSSGAKRGYLDGRVPKLSSRVTLATSGPEWSVISPTFFCEEQLKNCSFILILFNMTLKNQN